MKLKNIGKVSEEWLKEIGIYNYEDLNEIGAAEAFKRIKQKRPGVSLNLLYALEGALWGIHYLELDRQIREQVKREYEKSLDQI
ncbi:TfoX/Sxy family protein [Pseudalkalibacillus sp. A8]|uniref:TfoX/Sxy family protein n=1 Tax=Pseudalkalibacillus sp. A8 TaxID=3382641 RepID=UPI0038B618BC